MSDGSTSLAVAAALESAESAGWLGPGGAVAVVVSTHGRAGLLGGLLDTLERQAGVDFEVVVADNGSPDETWAALVERCASTPLRLLALRLPFHDGPGVPRNTCVAAARASLIAFTDDDCLPTPGWLAALVAAFDDSAGEGVDIVQGATAPEPGGWAGPWGRSLSVPAASGLFETANLAVRRTSFEAAGGFGAKRLLSGRAFGEDVVLGAAIAAGGGFRFAPDALVHHRVMPGSYRDFLRERWRLMGFPLLVRMVPELRSRAYLGIFLGRRRAITDLGVCGLLLAIGLAAAGRWLGLLALLAAVPWATVLWREAGARPCVPRPLRAAQLLVADLVGFAALLIGSARARRLLL
ncbi:MAG TPA: glycosyltransferase family A protein [Mycobacteriales bacterium]|nr:glycosyltransferase family A protein [Mycobacteriales bacterium]